MARDKELVLVAAPTLLAGAVHALWLASFSELATDEFTYAHAAWLIATGQEPFRDFFLHHFPLSMQLGSLVLDAASEPSDVIHLRGLMVPFWAGTLVAAALLCARRGMWAALFAPLFLLVTNTWLDRATEFRPDAVALPLFLFSLWLATRAGGRASAVGAGVCFVAAVWASQKVLVYGAVLPAALLIDGLWNERPALAAAPAPFALGAAAAAAPILVYLLATDNWAPWWRWCWDFAVQNESTYPPLNPFRTLPQLLGHSSWIVALALVEIGVTVRAMGRSWRTHPDLLLCALVVTSWASYGIQRAPYNWSLLPFVAVLVLFAARGAARLLAWALRGPAAPLSASVVALLLVAPAAQLAYLIHRSSSPAKVPRNAVQLAALDQLAELTRPTDPVYDNTGRYVARPHVHFLFFTNETIRIAMADRLVTEMPAAIVTAGAPVFMPDQRASELPQPLRRFLADNFQPYSRDFHLWGKRFELGPGESATFHAITDGDYLLAATRAVRLLVDDRVVDAGVLELSRGPHRLQALAGASFCILWLPRNGERWLPGTGVCAE